MLDDRRALDLRVEFTHQRRTIEDHPAPADGHDVHVFTGQGLTDRPFAPFDFQLALTVDLGYSQRGGCGS